MLVLKGLIEQGKNEEFRKEYPKHDIFSADEHGNSLLHHAAINDQYDVAKLLIELGVPVEVNNHMRLTPLHMALMFRNNLTANLLLKHGADPNAQTSMGITPIFYAVQRSNAEMLEELLKRGAVLHAQTHNLTTVFELANGRSHYFVNSIVEKLQNLPVNDMKMPLQSENYITARADFSNVGVVPFSPELLANPSESKGDRLDKYFIASYKSEKVQIRVVKLPNLKNQYIETILDTINEKKCFLTPKLMPLIGITFVDKNSYGIISWHKQIPSLKQIIESKVQISDYMKWMIITDIIRAVDSYLSKVPAEYENLFLDPTTIYYDAKLQSSMLEVDGKLSFDIHDGVNFQTEFTAPEVLAARASTKLEAQATLVYSIGALIYYFMTGSSRFPGQSNFDIGLQVTKAYEKGESVYKTLFSNDDIEHLFQLLVKPDYSKRPHVWQIENCQCFRIIGNRLQEDENLVALHPSVTGHYAGTHQMATTTSLPADQEQPVESQMDTLNKRFSQLTADQHDSTLGRNPEESGKESESGKNHEESSSTSGKEHNVGGYGRIDKISSEDENHDASDQNVNGHYEQLEVENRNDEHDAPAQNAMENSHSSDDIENAQQGYEAAAMNHVGENGEAETSSDSDSSAVQQPAVVVNNHHSTSSLHSNRDGDDDGDNSSEVQQPAAVVNNNNSTSSLHSNRDDDGDDSSSESDQSRRFER